MSNRRPERGTTYRRTVPGVVLLFALRVGLPVLASEAPADQVAKATRSAVRPLIQEVLDRNPDIAASKAAAEAAKEKAPQVKSLPDPMIGATLYALTPETRVGPTQGMVKFTQKVPWLSKLTLREKAALHAAEAAAAKVEAIRLKKITMLRTILYRLAFLDEQEEIVKEDREALVHYEALARARYAAGIGRDQAVVKIQAEITKDDELLLAIASKRISLLAKVNELRNRPAMTPVAVPPLPDYPSLSPDLASLRTEALRHRPEMRAAEAKIKMRKARVELAKKDYRPDFTLSLTYGAVLPRDDTMGRANPPDDNGQDVVGLSAGINLPIWKKKLDAALREAGSRETRAAEEKRSVASSIEAELDDLVQRLPLAYQQLDLFRKVLSVQAEQALNSAEAAYTAGTMGALDLLDAERILLKVRVATKQAKTDYATYLAKLEGAMGAPIRPETQE